MSVAVVVYLACVAVVGGGLVLRTWLWLRASTRARRQRLQTREKMDPINTHSPVGDSTVAATEHGLESIQRQFTVYEFLLIPLIIILTLFVAVIPFLGAVPATFVSLIAAAITVILGVAARPFIENAIAGLVIAFSRLLSIGDTVKLDDHYGTIEDITVTHTTIKIWDWRRYIVPNTRMLNATLINYSLNDSYVWVSVEFHVAYEADINQVAEIAIAAPTTSQHYREYEPPRFWVMELGKETIRCWVAAWAGNPPEAWLLSHDTRTELIRQFRRCGIETHTYRVDLGEGHAGPQPPQFPERGPAQAGAQVPR